MALTRRFKQTIAERAQRDPAFAQALLDEAATLFLNGEPEIARVILRDLVNTTVGFEGLAKETDKPSMDNLAAIFSVIRTTLGVKIEVHAVPAM